MIDNVSKQSTQNDVISTSYIDKRKMTLEYIKCPMG